MFATMATDTSGEPLPANPCCKLWKKDRDMLCKAMRILCPKLDQAEAENLRLKKEYEEEKASAVAERERIKRELDIKENEVSDLKSEMVSLQQRYEQDLREREEEAKLLQDQVSEGKNEINRLKEPLEKEKIVPDNEEGKRGKAIKESKKLKAEKTNDEQTKLLRARISEGKKEIRELKKLLDQEKRRADCESRIAEAEKNKAGDCLAQLDALSQEANQTKSELVLMTAKLDKVSKQLEAEKEKRRKHKKHEDSQIATGKDQKNLANQSLKKADEEKTGAESLSRQYAAARQEIEELQKQIENQKAISLEMHAGDMVKAEEQRRLVEAHKKMALEEKYHANELAQQLREATAKIKNLQKQVDELQSSGKSVEVLRVLPHKEKDAGKSEIRILKKELKLERMNVKHAKQVAELEKVRKDVLEEEMGHLKLEFLHFSNRLNLLDGCLSTDREGTDDVVKMNGCRKRQQLHRPSPVNLLCDNIHINRTREGVAVSDPLKQAHQSTLLIPRSRQQCSESISGTDPRLESLIGGSNKKGLQSPRINSSAASFSDGQIVVSQGKGDFSETTSVEIAEDNLKMQPLDSNVSGKTRLENNANVCLVDEDNLRISCSDVFGLVNKKSRRTLEAVECIQALYAEDRKLHSQIEEKLGFLRHILTRKRTRPLEEERTSLTDLHGMSYANDTGLRKKRKVSHEKISVMENGGEPKKSKKVKTSERKICKDLIISGDASRPAGNLMGNVSVSGEKTCDATLRMDEAGFRLEELQNADYMKFDNSEDEKCYKMATEMPLSPSVPEIDFQDGEIIGKDDMPLSHCIPEINYQDGKNISKDKYPTKSLDMTRNSGDGLCATIQPAGPSFLCVRNTELATDVSTVSRPGNELKSVDDFVPRHCVVFSSTKDRNSIAKIFQATGECIELCPSIAQTETVFLEGLLALKTRGHLSVKEKVCILLSLLLHNFSAAVSAKFGSCSNSISFDFLNGFARHINAVAVNDEVRSLLTELLDELLNLLQDFLADGRLLYSAVSSDLLDECDLRISINLDGLNVELCNKAASANQLLAGSVVLAALCSAVNRVAFLCETSFDILHKHSHDTSVLLTIVHVFAYLAGDEFFSVKEYELTMSVLKSIVMFLENGHPVAAMMDGVHLHPEAKCPFFDGSASLEVVVALLLASVQRIAQTGVINQNLNGLADSTRPSMDTTEQRSRPEDAQSVFGTFSDASSSLLHTEMNGTLCQLCDVVSLLELLAGYMGWKETSSHIVSPLLKILDMPLAVDFSVAIVTVLGQLGSLGVKTAGFEESVVKYLRQKLSAFLQRETTIRGGLPIQIATVSSLLRLLPFAFHEITKGSARHQETLDLSVHLDLIRKWFSLLSYEQQAISSRLLESSLVSD